jgi:hypothetical protein
VEAVIADRKAGSFGKRFRADAAVGREEGGEERFE